MERLAMDTPDYVSLTGVVAVSGLVMSLWQDKKDQEKRLSTLESTIKHAESDLARAVNDLEKLELKLDTKIENIENKLTAIAVSISRIETTLTNISGNKIV